ncbi:MAG: hypothetical protein LBN21_05220 [Treponema sp.]|jgi:hypothetical protein|nr:hypothetical protein [Treponema sp.]
MTIKRTGCIIVGIAIVLTMSSCHNIGYASGKKAGIKAAQSGAERQYKPKIAALKSELDGVKPSYEKKIKTIKNNHAVQINTINNNHTAQITNMNQNHNAKISEINRNHNAKISGMQNAHAKKLEQTRNDNFSKGQSAMNSRISDMIDLDAENKPAVTNWNATVYSINSYR